MPFGEPPPALSGPAALPSTSAPVGTYVDRPTASHVAPQSTTAPLPENRRVIVSPVVDEPTTIPGSRGAGAAPLETYDDSSRTAPVDAEPPATSDEPLIDVVIPSRQPGRGTSAAGAFGLPGSRYPATKTPDRDGGFSMSDVEEEGASAATAKDDGLVPVAKPSPPVKPAAPIEPSAKLPAVGSTPRGNEQSSAAPLPNPQFRTGAAVPIPAKGSRVDPSKLPQSPILLPAR